MGVMNMFRRTEARGPAPLQRYDLPDETLMQLLELDIAPNRPLLALDADGVLLEFAAHFTRFAEAQGWRATVADGAAAIFDRNGAPAPKDEASALMGRFFRSESLRQTLMPGALEGLAALSGRAQCVVLTSAPRTVRERRTARLRALGLDMPVVCVDGAKGAALRYLWDRTKQRVAFVDDSPRQILSAQKRAPGALRVLLGERAHDPAADYCAADWRQAAPILRRALLDRI